MLIHIKYEKMRQTERVNVVSYRLKVRRASTKKDLCTVFNDVKTSSGINGRQ